jgi:hypothetical protein
MLLLGQERLLDNWHVRKSDIDLNVLCVDSLSKPQMAAEVQAPSMEPDMNRFSKISVRSGIVGEAKSPESLERRCFRDYCVDVVSNCELWI